MGSSPSPKAPGDLWGGREGSLAGFGELPWPVPSSGWLSCWACLPEPEPEPGRGGDRVRSGLLAVCKRLDRNSCTHLGGESLRGIASFSWRGSILGEVPVDSLLSGGGAEEGSGGECRRASMTPAPCSALSRTHGGVPVRSQDKKPCPPDPTFWGVPAHAWASGVGWHPPQELSLWLPPEPEPGCPLGRLTASQGAPEGEQTQLTLGNSLFDGNKPPPAPQE